MINLIKPLNECILEEKIIEEYSAIELLYVWIKEFKNIKEQGFNFGGEYLFSYDMNSETLDIRTNKNYIKNFFNYNYNDDTEINGLNILNITTIIGQNGTGKTSLFNFFLKYFSDGMRSSEPEAIVVYRIKFSNNFKYFIFINDSIKSSFDYDEFQAIMKNLTPENRQVFVNSFDLNNSLKIYDYKRNADENKLINILKSLGCYWKLNFCNSKIDIKFVKVNSLKELNKSIDFIYLSTFFQPMPNYFEHNWKGIINLSTDFLVRKDYERRNAEISSLININEHFLNEIQRMVGLFVNKEIIHNIEKFFKLPKYLAIYPSNLDKEYFQNKIIQNKLDDDFLHPINKMLSNFQFAIAEKGIGDEENKVDVDTKKIFISNLKKNIILNIFRKYVFSNPISPFKESILKAYLTIMENGERFDSFIDELIKFNLPELKFLKILIETIITIPEDIVNANRILINLENPNNLDMLNNLISSYLSYNPIYPFLDFNFLHSPYWNEQPLSSGEYSLLTQAGRLHDSSLREKKKNLVLLFDESDLSLHPEWQRRYVDTITNFCRVFYQGFNLQMFLTSHSPFIASDLPSSNVLLLEKKDDRISANLAIEVNKDTFGANIYDLFKDSFFMNSFMGEYSKNVITWVIRKLNDEKTPLNNDELEKIKKVIEQIAEPIVKKELYRKYLQKINSEINEEKIKLLEFEIEKLNKRINQLKNEHLDTP